MSKPIAYYVWESYVVCVNSRTPTPVSKHRIDQKLRRERGQILLSLIDVLMYRPGIWSREQLLNSPETICGFRIAVAYNLADLPVSAAPDDLKAFERTTKAVKLSSGVYRTTYHSRFSDLDIVTKRVMRSIFARHLEIQVHDWAASGGLVSVEWANDIFTDFPQALFVASDYYLFLIEATSRGETYILEPDGTAIQYINPPFVVPLAARERSVFILNRLAIAWARRTVPEVKKLALQVKWDSFRDLRTYVLDKWAFRQLNLVHPQARMLEAEGRRFRVVQHDAFCPLRQPCHVLRVMNFYNPRVWGHEKVKSGLKAALDSVVDGGLLIIGRTIEDERTPRNDASILRKSGNSVKVIERLGSGFEMEDTILSFSILG